MLIDATHKKWALGFALGTAAGAAIYAPYARMAPQGPRGSSALGLTFGILAFLLMLFAGLLGARKKAPVLRVGRVQHWMRGHLWLGLLSLPLVLYHAGFTWGAGALSRMLMILTVIVIASGIVGAALQHFLPRVMTREVPMETIYEQVDSIREQLKKEAQVLVAAAEKELAKAQPVAVAAAAGGEAGAAEAPTVPPLEVLQEFVAKELMPFLEDPKHSATGWQQRGVAQRAFGYIHTLLPPAVRPWLEDLENICEEERQLLRQERLHAWLHGWLLVHVPLSYGLLVLVAVHAVMALRY
jgi:hypothetical protein